MKYRISQLRLAKVFARSIHLIFETRLKDWDSLVELCGRSDICVIANIAKNYLPRIERCLVDETIETVQDIQSIMPGDLDGLRGRQADLNNAMPVTHSVAMGIPVWWR